MSDDTGNIFDSGNEFKQRLSKCLLALQEYRENTHGAGYESKMTHSNTSHEEVCSLIAQIGAKSILEIGCAAGALKNSVNFPSGALYRGIDPLRINGVAYDFPFMETTLEEMPSDFASGIDCFVIKDSIDCLFDLDQAMKIMSSIFTTNGFLIVSESCRGAEIRSLSSGASSAAGIVASEVVLRTYPTGRKELSDILRSAISSGFSIEQAYISSADRGTLLFKK